MTFQEFIADRPAPLDRVETTLLRIDWALQCFRRFLRRDDRPLLRREG